MGKCFEHDWIAMNCKKCGGFLGMGCLNCDAWADGGERLASSPDEWCHCENPESDYPDDGLLQCPSCEGLGEIKIGGSWSMCKLCHGEGGLTQRALDAANAALAEHSPSPCIVPVRVVGSQPRQ